jgi:hypothetical protein
MPKYKRLQIPLSLDDVLEVHLIQEGSVLRDFSIQYKAFICGEWRRVIRYDTAHGFVHVHRAWRQEEDHDTVPQVDGLPYAAVLHWVEKDLKDNWARYRKHVEGTYREKEERNRKDGEEE